MIIIILLLIGFNYLEWKNQMPVILNFNSDLRCPQPASVNIYFTVNSSDNDGDKIYYKFLVDGQTQQDWSENDTWEWNTDGLKTGEYAIQVQARDLKHGRNQGDFDCCKYVLFRIENQPPELISLYSNHSSPSPSGTYINWTVESIDKNGDKIYYRFLVDGNVEQNWSASNVWLWNTQDLQTDDYHIQVQLRDLKHAISVEEYDVERDVSFRIERPYGLWDIARDTVDFVQLVSGVGELRILGKKAYYYLAKEKY